MAEDIKKQKEFIKNVFPNYELLLMDNSTCKGIDNKKRFPTDMRIKYEEDELNLQFTELQATSYSTHWKIKFDNYKQDSPEYTLTFSDFLLIFSKDKKKFYFDNHIKLFDVILIYDILDYIIDGRIEIIDIETNIEEDYEYLYNLITKIKETKKKEELKEIFNKLMRYEKVKLKIVNKYKVTIDVYVKEKHYPFIRNKIICDFKTFYSVDLLKGFKKVLKNKNKYNKNEEKNLENWNISRENHILICHVFEYFNIEEFEQLINEKVISEKYKEIYVTHDNIHYLKIKTTM